MPSMYLVPKKGTEFPYDAVKEKIAAAPGVTTGDVDFKALIQKAQDSDWPPEIADNYRALEAGGKCFDFKQASDPGLRGTVYEENVYFTFDDEDHHARCETFINELAAALGLETSIGFSE